MNRGDWMITVSGRRLYVGDPRPEDIVIEDIAHALAKYPRFGGHTPGDEIYSVAQHSVIVSQIFWSDSVTFDSEDMRIRGARGALLHDAAEAYLGDVIRPVKAYIAEALKPLEDLWEAVIFQRFNALAFPRLVKRADLEALATERRDLLPFADPKLNPEAWKWKEDELAVRAWPEHIVPMSIPQARAAFLARFEELGGLRG